MMADVVAAERWWLGFRRIWIDCCFVNPTDLRRKLNLDQPNVHSNFTRTLEETNSSIHSFFLTIPCNQCQPTLFHPHSSSSLSPLGTLETLSNLIMSDESLLAIDLVCLVGSSTSSRYWASLVSWSLTGRTEKRKRQEECTWSNVQIGKRNRGSVFFFFDDELPPPKSDF